MFDCKSSVTTAGQGSISVLHPLGNYDIFCDHIWRNLNNIPCFFREIGSRSVEHTLSFNGALHHRFSHKSKAELTAAIHVLY